MTDLPVDKRTPAIWQVMQVPISELQKVDAFYVHTL